MFGMFGKIWRRDTQEGRAVKIKILLRFYFSAGSLNRALDNLILHLALAAGQDAYRGCGEYFDRITKLISDKSELSVLWAELDGVISGMTERDRAALSLYGGARGGIAEGWKREVHRAAVKFSRRAGRLLAVRGGYYQLLRTYRCLISSAPD